MGTPGLTLEVLIIFSSEPVSTRNSQGVENCGSVMVTRGMGELGAIFTVEMSRGMFRVALSPVGRILGSGPPSGCCFGREAVPVSLSQVIIILAFTAFVNVVPLIFAISAKFRGF